MTSKDIAKSVGCYYTYVQQQTKKALENGAKAITIKGQTFAFEMVSNTSGKAYSYTAINTKKAKQKSAKTISFALLDEIKEFDILSSSFSSSAKVSIIGFYRRYNYSLNTIIEALLVQKNILPTSKQIASLNKKISRWIEAFKSGGAKALEDKRGLNVSNSKVDERSLLLAIGGAGSAGIRDNFYGIWNFYNYIEAKKEGILNKPTLFKDEKTKSYISQSGLINAIKTRVFKEHPQIKAFLEKGLDALLQDYIVGCKDIGYINQEWQVDSTKFDFMCKIPTDDGYRIGRVNVTAVIDTFTKKAVASLTESIDSYAQVRVLYKAIEKMGVPETVYTDNGRDYTSNHYTKLLLNIGANQIRAEVGQGRQKGAIERFFGVVQSSWASIPGYIGNDVAKRVQIENQTASKIDVRTSKATRINEKRLLTLDELRVVVENLLDIKNVDFGEFENSKLSAVELENIRKMLGKSETRKVQTDGIRFNNIKYQSADIWLGGLNRGQKVEVYENIDNINEIYVYKLDGSYVGVATNIELGVEAMSLEEHKAAKKAYKKNNIAPVQEVIREGKKIWEEYQDFIVEQSLEHTPSYAQKSEKIEFKGACKSNSIPPSTKKLQVPLSSRDELLDFIEQVS